MSFAPSKSWTSKERNIAMRALCYLIGAALENTSDSEVVELGKSALKSIDACLTASAEMLESYREEIVRLVDIVHKALRQAVETTSREELRKSLLIVSRSTDS